LSPNTVRHECDTLMFRNTTTQMQITVHVATRPQAALTGVQADSLICKNGIAQHLTNCMSGDRCFPSGPAEYCSSCINEQLLSTCQSAAKTDYYC